MSKYWCHLGLALLASLLLLAVQACGAKEKQPTMTTANTTVQTPKGPDYQIFAPLEMPTTSGRVPFLLSADNGIVDSPCFRQPEEMTPKNASFDVKNLVEENEALVNKSIQKWFVEELAPAGLTQGFASKWDIEIASMVTLDVSNSDVRFADDQECISSSTGWLPEDVHAITMLIGARTFNFKSELPIDDELKEEMNSAVSAANLVMESESLFSYEPAVDDDGNPVVDKEGKQLYNSPSGTPIPESKIPPAEERMMKEWTVKAEEPVYFAFRELAEDAWRKESKKDLCDVYLVWGDVTPRPPECDEYKESKFVATQTEDGEVAITITTGDQNVGATIAFNRGKMVQINDRIILWVSPKKIEEGVLLRLNSLVLDPVGVSLSKKSYVPKRKPTRQVDDSEEASEKPKKKSKKKKKSMNDSESINDFLR